MILRRYFQFYVEYVAKNVDSKATIRRSKFVIKYLTVHSVSIHFKALTPEYYTDIASSVAIQ